MNRDPCDLASAPVTSVEVFARYVDQSILRSREGSQCFDSTVRQRILVKELIDCYMCIVGHARLYHREASSAGWREKGSSLFLSERIRKYQLLFHELWNKYIDVFDAPKPLKQALSVRLTSYSAEVDTWRLLQMCEGKKRIPFPEMVLKSSPSTTSGECSGDCGPAWSQDCTTLV